jgi:SAM-dependent methyltransferase
MLDMGCGPAEYLAHLPSGVAYTGLDMSQEYIAAATARYGSRGSFICGSFQEAASMIQGPFDVILAAGFLHHLDDVTAREFIRFSASRLSHAGRLITIDGAYRDGQHPIARLVLRLDRGRYVRPVREVEALLAIHFRNVQLHVREDLLRIPYTHLITECGMPKS